MNAAHRTRHHQTWLLRLLLALFQRAGVSPGGEAVVRMPKPLRLGVLRELVPAESALRRLIYFIAQRMIGPVPSPRSGRAGKKRGCPKAGTAKTRAPLFNLYDRRKFFPELVDRRKRPLFGRPGPRIIFLDEPTPPPEPEKPERDADDATSLCRRLQAVHGALLDIERQAVRMRRIMEKRRNNPPGPGRREPIRPGHAPGRRAKRVLEIDEILFDCHVMAWYDRAPPEP